MSTYDMTKGNILKNLLRFSLPYLLSCFLQTFYGLADLFVIGRFNGAASITAVSVGSQLTHMLTVVIVGLAMGSTVAISRSITMIANRRGVEAAAAVGIVEKVISFLFLVPSSMLSAVSTICAQNLGAKQYDRSRKALFDGILICAGTGVLFTTLCQFCAPQILGLFTNGEPGVVRLGAQYLRTYSIDCILAGIHFCYGGYFCACERPMLSFAHNLVSILTIRIPGAYLASLYWPETLAPMGLAAPTGSLLSIVICTVLFLMLERRRKTHGNF